MSDSIRIQQNTKVSSLETSSKDKSQVSATGTSFQQYLDLATNVKFSNHAQKRLDVREIDMDDNNRLTRLSDAVDKASAHGSKESLILMDDLAFIVNVRERMVVTTVDMNKKKDGVFTQIDSVVIADPSDQNTGSV